VLRLLMKSAMHNVLKFANSAKLYGCNLTQFLTFMEFHGVRVVLYVLL
jgi:cytosine/uracil/thiamine/allantoin permease